MTKKRNVIIWILGVIVLGLLVVIIVQNLPKVESVVYDCSNPNGMDGQWLCRSSGTVDVCDTGSWQFNGNCVCNMGQIANEYDDLCESFGNEKISCPVDDWTLPNCPSESLCQTFIDDKNSANPVYDCDSFDILECISRKNTCGG